MRGAPLRPEDDRFHIPTWRAFLEKMPSSHMIATRLYYVVSRSSPAVATSEEREDFATKSEAQKWADDCNRKLLAETLHLQDIANVIPFSTLPAAPQSNVLAQEKSRSDQLISS